MICTNIVNMNSRRQTSAIYLILLSIILSACGPLPTRPGQPSNGFIGNDVVSVASQYLGTPYKWGGATPETGFDCSGLVAYSYAQVGVNLPRTSRAQFEYVKPVNYRFLKPGDLLFFRLRSTRVSHVGIYIGENQFIHAPRTGKDVSVANLLSKFWRKRFVGAGRPSY